MCGIAGLVDLEGRRRPDDSRLQRMSASQHHRGPDEAGIHVSDGIGLVHQRLSIIDLSSGQQPLYNEDGSVVVVFNGEIYNHEALAGELRSLGHVFRTRCDTETIVHAWEQWGEECVQRFRGMFAFALWDERAGILLLARDRLGVKPLYYARLRDGFLAFGSELKSLWAAGGLESRIDPQATVDYFTLGYVPEPRSILSGVSKLPAGHILKLQRSVPPAKPRRYWSLRFKPDSTLDERSVAEELKVRLRDSIAMRMVADVPLGAFLSGGIDSGAVVALMSEASNKPVTTCSIGFDDPEFDETDLASQVARRHGATHHVGKVAIDDFDLVDRLASVYDEPFADSSAMPTYRVCELARRFVRVALSGDGGDEGFGGYRRYRTHLREQSIRDRIPGPVREHVISRLGRWYPELRGAPRWIRARALLNSLSESPEQAYLREVSILRADDRQALFSPALVRDSGGYDTLSMFNSLADEADTDDPLALIQYLDYRTYLVDDINTKVDRASMANSLEVREPLMDHCLVEWLATVPSSMKVRGDVGKAIFKDVVRPLLPEEVVTRRKMGFAVPISRWFRGPLRSRAVALSRSEWLLGTGWMNEHALQATVDQHLSGQADRGSQIWTLLMFEAFLKRHLGAANQ